MRTDLPCFRQDCILPFDIRSFDCLQQQTLEQPHRHAYFEMGWIDSGNGALIIDTQEYTLSPAFLYCIPPGSIHYCPAAHGINGYLLSFDASFLQQGPDLKPYTALLTSLSRQITMVTLSEEQYQQEIRMLLTAMDRESGNHDLLRMEVIRGLLKLLLIYVGRLRSNSGPPAASNRNELVSRFYDKLETTFLTVRSVADYAAELSVTPSYLNEIVKRVSGFPPSYHIHQRVILEARRLATYSGASMKEIAGTLGFDDISYFSKYFKHFSGENFRVFKRKSLQA